MERGGRRTTSQPSFRESKTSANFAIRTGEEGAERSPERSPVHLSLCVAERPESHD